MKKTALIIGQVWPEPETNGAGYRMMQLIGLLDKMDIKVVFASTAQRGPYSYPLEQDGIDCIEIKLNHSSFDSFIVDLDPELVIFDRFAIEEQFSWRVAENCPEAVRILDSEDLHFLRAGRQRMTEHPRTGLFEAIPEKLQNRELASICRSDITLVISEFEMELLTGHYRIDPDILFYLPFLFTKEMASDVDAMTDFERRKGFMCIGNWKHEPNKDAIHFLKSRIWPLIRQEQPEAEMHVYGAYAVKESSRLHEPEVGFHLMGWAENKRTAFQKHKVCLAPLRFGAGLKGKLFDAMQFGTPCVTSSVGAEGLQGSMAWNGCVEDDAKRFAHCAIRLYEDKDKWLTARQNGFRILEDRFGEAHYAQRLKKMLNRLPGNLKDHRRKNWVGSMLWHHSLLSTKYLSRWIEEKNKDQRTMNS